MIVQALANYYEQLAQKGAIARPGWAKAKISFALEIDQDGRLLSVLPLESPDDTGKKMRPQLKELPAPVVRTDILPNFLWDNSAYLLGFDGKGKPDRAIQCFNDAKLLHQEMLRDVDDAFARAICLYFDNLDIEGTRERDDIIAIKPRLEAGANLTFLFQDGTYPADNAALRDAWQTKYNEEKSGDKVRCLVSGELVVPENTHPSIKNLRGAQSSGAALVSFNAKAFCSYEKEQNQNAPVGKSASFAYTAALNHLLSEPKHKKYFGDTTVVFWAEDAQVQYQAYLASILGGESDQVTSGELYAMMSDLAQGRPILFDKLTVQPDNHIYILGLSPNASRISVRFFLRDSIGAFSMHIQKHYAQLEIVKPEYDQYELLPLWRLLSETVNQKSRSKDPLPQMAGDVLRCILTGGHYPATLYQQTQLRIRAEREVTRGRAAIIKAFLMRNTTNPITQEGNLVQLNESTTYQPYLLGRLFALLEAIQSSANPGINTTIKDKYFSSACATPAMIFPTLIKLAQSHLRKLSIGLRITYEKQLGEITTMLTQTYPTHLSLPDQGVFQLGYYHQTQKRFEKKTSVEG